MPSKYIVFIKLLISFSLYQYIFNSVNHINLKDEINKSKNNVPFRNSNNRMRKEYNEINQEIKEYIENINSYLINNYPCKIYYIYCKVLINLEKKIKIFYFLEIRHSKDKFRYYLYNPKYRGYAVNIDSCKEVNITYNNMALNFSDYYKDYDHLFSYLDFLNKSKNINLAFSQIFKDPCYQIAILDYYDILLENNKRDLINNKLSLCDDNCTFEGINIEKLELNCYCQEKIDMNKENMLQQIIYQFKNFGNLQVFGCYKLLSLKNGQQNNYGSQIVLFLIIINIISIIYINSILYKKYHNLISYYKKYIGTNIFDFKKINKLNFKNLSITNLTPEQSDIIDDLCKYINDNSYNNKNEINNSERNDVGHHDNLKEEIIRKLNNGKLKDYYNCIINLFPKETYKNYLIEDELNGLDFDEYKEMEYRNFLDIFCSIFKTNYDFISTFFIFDDKDYRIYPIKVITYIDTLLLSLDINISFYNDDTMHKIYKDIGESFSLDRLPIIIMTNLLSFIPSIFIEILFSSYQDNFIALKTNMDDENDDEIIQKSYKNLSIKIRTYCVFSILFDFFSWYYISCFFAVYLKTQKAIFIDVLHEFILNIISFLLLSIIYTIIKIIFIKTSCNRKSYNWRCFILYIMNKFWFINIFSIVLQYFISLLFHY